MSSEQLKQLEAKVFENGAERGVIPSSIDLSYHYDTIQFKNKLRKEHEMTFEKLKEIIMKETGKKDIELTDETTFKDLGFDSIDAIDILMDIEDEFGIEIQDDSEALNNIGDLVKLIEEKINA